MAEFDSIKKIIRLFTIALLALWLAQCLFGAHESAKVMSEHHQIVNLQMLYNQGFKIRRMLNFFYTSNDRLPEPHEYQDLECAHPFARCPFREWQGYFFVREGPQWLALRPAIEGDRLAFRCRTNSTFKGETTWKPPYDCELVEGPLPFPWPEETASQPGEGAGP